MGTRLSPSEALDGLSADSYFIMAKDGKEQLMRPDALLALLKSVKDGSAWKEVAEPLTARMDSIAGEAALLRGRVGLLEHETPTATSLGLSSFVGEQVASGCDTSDGLVRAKDVVDYIEAQGFVSRGQLFPGSSLVLGEGAGMGVAHKGKNVVLGAGAGVGSVVAVEDFVALGAGSQVLHSNAVALGNTDQTVHTARGVVTRADARDFTGVGLDLGLSFLLGLKPLRATMDLREDYIDYSTLPEPPKVAYHAPTMPMLGEGETGYQEAWDAYRVAKAAWLKDHPTYLADVKAWQEAYATWKSANAPGAKRGDGSKAKGESFVVLADDLLLEAEKLGSSFPGTVDSLTLGGMDVKGVRTDELIPVLIKGIQDLYAYMRSDTYLDKLAEAMLRKMNETKAALTSASTGG